MSGFEEMEEQLQDLLDGQENLSSEEIVDRAIAIRSIFQTMSLIEDRKQAQEDRRQKKEEREKLVRLADEERSVSVRRKEEEADLREQRTRLVAHYVDKCISGAPREELDELASRVREFDGFQQNSIVGCGPVAEIEDVRDGSISRADVKVCDD